MGSYRKRLLNDFPALMAFLTGETWVDSNDSMTSSCSLVLKDIEECAPRGVENTLRHMVIFHHVRDLKVFNGNDLILISVVLCDLEVMITALSVDLQVGFGDVSGGFLAATTALLATTHLPLLTPERFLRGAIEARIVDGLAFTIGKKDFQAHINADLRMVTDRGSVFKMRLRLTHDQGVPVSLGSQHEMHRLWLALEWTVQLDLEDVTQFPGDNKVFLVFMQVTVFAILAQLNAMPAVGLLETGKADACTIMFLGCEEPCE